MKQLFLAMTAVAAIAAASPAAAQYGAQTNANAYGGANVQNRIARLDARIDAGVQAGTIDRREARSLRQQLRTITQLERQYSRNGLSQQESADLQMRVRTFRDQLRLAGGTGYGNGYGNGNGNAYGNNNNGYGNGQYGRNDDRYDDRYTGQGGPYENCNPGNGGGGLGGVLGGGLGGGLGGIIDSIFGGGNDDDCGPGLRVGQRVSGNLGAVPYQYRGQYRDGGNVYYRSDGSQIYQIDARTHTIVRIYGMNR